MLGPATIPSWFGWWQRHRQAAEWLLFVAIGSLLAGECIWLGWENHALREMVDGPGRAVPDGGRIFRIAGSTLEGAAFEDRLGLAGAERLVVITFAPGCPFCRRSVPSWKALAADGARYHYRVLWVSREDRARTLRYCVSMGISGRDVIADPAYDSYVQLGLRFVPRLVVLGPAGLVERSWTGYLDDSAYRQVERYLGVPITQ